METNSQTLLDLNRKLAFAKDKDNGYFYVDKVDKYYGAFGLESGFCYVLTNTESDAEAFAVDLSKVSKESYDG